MMQGGYLLFKHCTCGLPVYPMGHVQLDACSRDLQMAFAPQGSTLHASLQVPSTHLSGSLQSLSTTQEATGVTREKENEELATH